MKEIYRRKNREAKPLLWKIIKKGRCLMNVNQYLGGARNSDAWRLLINLRNKKRDKA